MCIRDSFLLGGVALDVHGLQVGGQLGEDVVDDVRSTRSHGDTEERGDLAKHNDDGGCGDEAAQHRNRDKLEQKAELQQADSQRIYTNGHGDSGSDSLCRVALVNYISNDLGGEQAHEGRGTSRQICFCQSFVVWRSTPHTLGCTHSVHVSRLSCDCRRSLT